MLILPPGDLEVLGRHEPSCLDVTEETAADGGQASCGKEEVRAAECSTDANVTCAFGTEKAVRDEI